MLAPLIPTLPAPVCRALPLVALLLPGVAPITVAQYQTMTIERLAPGVYGAIYSEMERDPVQSNALIVVGDSAVCVVDAHYTPRAARATIAEIRKLTPLPVRYLVTTHWHDDHVFGNQAYRAAWPGVTIVAHDQVRASMLARIQEHRDELVEGYDKAVASVANRLQTGLDRDGKPLSPGERARLTRLLPVLRTYAGDFREVKPVMPDVTFDREVMLHLGGRDVRVMSLGPGNTRGDAVIFLPAERVAAVGDLLVYPVPFIYGGFPASWVKVLQRVRDLDPAILVPGHGPVMRDFAYLEQVSALLTAMARQADAAVSRGLTLAQARDSMDLSSFHAGFVAGNPDREETWQASILTSGVKAAFDEATAARKPG